MRRLPALLTALLLLSACGRDRPPPVAESAGEPGRLAELAPTPDDPEAGRPFVTTFGSADFDATSVATSVVEDDRGVLYAGTGGGVLEYDGAAWRLVLVPGAYVYSLARDAEGRIWVGGIGEVGYLAPDARGRMRYVSLKDRVPEAHRDFGEVFQTQVTDGGVVFNASGVLFRWAPAAGAPSEGAERAPAAGSLRPGSGEAGPAGAMEVWTTPEGFHTASVVDGTFYARAWGRGLLRLDETAAGDSLRLVPGGERFAQTRIYTMLPFDEKPVSEGGRILVGTREEGLFLWDPAAAAQAFTPFETEADEVLERGGLYLGGSALPGGRFALSTLSEGAVVIDRAGRLVRHLDETAGLPGSSVNATYEDGAGGLWLAMSNAGLARVELGAQATRYGPEDGLPGETFSLARHGGRLYAAHFGEGMTYLDAAAGRFRPVEGAPPESLGQLSVAGDLLVAGANDGLYRVVEGPGGPRAEVVRASSSYDYRATSLHAWGRDSTVVFVGLQDGLGVLRRRGAGWEDLGRVPGVDGNPGFLAEGADGAVWLGSEVGRPARVVLPAPGPDGGLDPAEASVTVFGPEDGLPPTLVYPFRVGGEVVLSATGERVFRFDPSAAPPRPDSGPAGAAASGRLVEWHAFDAAKTGHPLSQLWLTEDARGRVWITTPFGPPVVASPRSEAEASGPADGGPYTFEPLRRFRQDRIEWSYAEPDGVVWLVSEGGAQLVRYDPRQAAAATGARPPLVRSVSLGDSLLWGGDGEATAAEVAHGAEAVRFAYAAPGGAEAARYRTRLVGFDEGWSAWTAEAERAYTNLPAGHYTFRVEAEGRDGVASYELRVLPPWYGTWWAYVLYALAAAGLVGAVVRGRTAHLEAQRRELEQTVTERTVALEERTVEVEQQRRAAEQRAEELAEVNRVQEGLVSELDTVNRVSRALVAQLDFDALVHLVGEQMRETFSADIAYVALLDREAGRITFPYVYGERLAPIAYGEGLTSQILRTREPLLIDHDVVGRVEAMGIEPVGKRAASYLGVPILAGDAAIGVISVQTTEAESRFGADDLRLLGTIAANVGVALENAESYHKLGAALDELKQAQAQLVQSEKMASLGALTAGIAHEIKNPLNFVINFAKASTELVQDLREELAASGDGAPPEGGPVSDIMSDLAMMATMIAEHGDRADRIVKSMLQHSRQGGSTFDEVAVNAFVDDYVDLAFHGMRAHDSDFNVDIVRDYDDRVGSIQAVPQELGRVLVNLLNNAFYAVHEQKGRLGGAYAPRVRVSTRQLDGEVEIRVEDNGPGMPASVQSRVFEPFFTTKPPGEGTGLGLSLSYDVVTQMHGGRLGLETGEGAGTAFVVTLPVRTAGRVAISDDEPLAVPDLDVP